MFSRREWAPVVYGRTQRADDWWRAAPGGKVDRWLRDAVHACVASGTDLQNGPRFVLASASRRHLVGGACMLRDISDSMNDDGRPLYGFVGWVTDNDSTAAAPDLATLRKRFAAWAGPVYVEHVKADWTADQPRLRESKPGRAVWPRARSTPSRPLAEFAESTMVMPGSRAVELWEAGRATQKDFTVVVGWRNHDHIPMRLVTHAASADLVKAVLLRWPPPPPEAPSRPAFVTSELLRQLWRLMHDIGGRTGEGSRPRDESKLSLDDIDEARGSYRLADAEVAGLAGGLGERFADRLDEEDRAALDEAIENEEWDQAVFVAISSLAESGTPVTKTEWFDLGSLVISLALPSRYFLELKVAQ